MAIKIRCDSCEKGFKAPDEAAGKSIKCPGCGTAIRVPEQDAAGNGETGGDSPIRLGKAAKVKKKLTRCWSCAIEVSPQDLECPDCGASLKTEERRKAPIPGKKRRRKKKKKQEVPEDDWRESLFGAFAYAFPAVLRGQGWLCCLWGAGMMTAMIPAGFILGVVSVLCIPFVGPLLFLALMFVAAGAAPAGIMSRNMEIASRWGARGVMKEWQMSAGDEMIPSAIEILKATSVLGLLPLLIAGFVASAFGNLNAELFSSSTMVGQVGGILTLLAYFGVAMVCSFCTPMCIMLLGAGDVSSAVYPPTVFRMLMKTFVEYLAFYFYIFLLAVATYILSVLLGVLVLMTIGSPDGLWSTSMVRFLGFVVAFIGASFVISAVATYFAAVVGWSMGIFIHRNYDHFEEVRD